CDVPELRDQVVVFTRRHGPSPYYQSFVAGSIKLDIRRLRPSDVVSIALSPEKQDQQNVRKLKGLNQQAWERLVNEIDFHGNQTDLDTNRDEFTKAEPQTIPTIAVVEEAQSVLGSSGSSGEGPYVTWVKEGRKYDLGAVLITQQPGSISGEILSQGDNWFIFHLLAAG